ncbi:hypothetical protein C1645_813626 [Glomus cerebriforme]|uniref:Phosphatidylglycerol/phosphatidylinositol transfer protein n=1 Tax=Glomus cerebriforme TaxID=658196 RepID=A0A397TS89_9GLOM|nr:hypothetical protein C1645_813626 [Glomus cerebriforme]
MKQNFISVFILLSTLLMVNAAPYQLNKRATKFIACPVKPTPPLFNNIILSPDPIVKGSNVTITASGSISVDIPKNIDVLAQVAFLDKDGILLADLDFVEFCSIEGINCPVKAGTNFEIVLNDIQVPDSNDLDAMTVAVRNNNAGVFFVCSESSDE